MNILGKTALKAALSLTAVALTISATVAAEKPNVDKSSPVVAKLLILPGDNVPAGASDIDSPARNVSLGGTFEGSSSHANNENNSHTDIIDDANLGKRALGITKSRKRVKIRRKVTRVKKQRVNVARASIPISTIKRRAPLILGVYR